MSGWQVHDLERDNIIEVGSRAEAEAKLEEFPELDLEIVPPATESDGGQAEVVDEPAPEPVEPTTVEHAGESYDLEARSVGDDPLGWIPDDFVDVIDGSQAINRKGFAVLGHFYKIETSSEIIVSPEETDFEFCRAKATATTKDGREYEAHGSAHVDRGDDPWLLLEMADTRAKKRAMADATGVGAVAVEELKNEVRH